MPKLTGLAHIGVFVSDMTRTLAFYCDTLGLTLDERFVQPNGTELAFVHVGACIIEFICRADHFVPNAEGPIAHICFDVEDIHGLVEDLRAKGVAFKADQPAALVGGLTGITNIFLTGPDGESLEFFDQSAKKQSKAV